MLKTFHSSLQNSRGSGISEEMLKKKCGTKGMNRINVRNKTTLRQCQNKEVVSVTINVFVNSTVPYKNKAHSSYIMVLPTYYFYYFAS